MLIMMLPRYTEIRVGRLGRIGFNRGWYAYAGSAFGPGGLAARLRHHLRPVQNPHWHIDYLRTQARVKEVWMAVGPPSREHDWASVMSKSPWAGRLVPGFGCSDCQCKSHLLHFDYRPGRDLISKKMGAEVDWLQPVPALP